MVLLWACAALGDVGLICTLKGEERQFLDEMKTVQKISIAERDFYRGEIEGRGVVLVRSPMGKVNNTITAQLLISHFHVESILSIGLGGAIDPSLRIGDVVLSESTLQHDFGLLKPYGFLWESPPELGKRLKPSPWGPASNRRYHCGVIVSGDQFIASEDKREWLRSKFHALAVDMSAAAIQEVCRQNAVGCLFIRIISDRADSEGREHFREAAQSKRLRSVEVAGELLKAQPAPIRSR